MRRRLASTCRHGRLLCGQQVANEGRRRARLFTARPAVSNDAVRRHTCDIFFHQVTSYALFPALRVRSSVSVSPFQKYVRITFIRNNSVTYVKIMFSVAVSLPFPFIRVNRIEFYFSVSVRYTVRDCGHNYVNC